MADDDARRSEPALVVGILGRIRALAGGRELDLGGPRQRALLAALAVELGRTVPTDTLIDAVWDGDPPDAADRTFRSYVSRLRKALGRAGVDGAEVVRTDAAGYRLDDRLAITDVRLFEAEVAEARQQLTAGQAAAAASQFAGALGRWEGQALGAFADRVWAAPTAVRLEEERLAAEELRVRALLDADRTADAVTRVEQLAAAEPLRESVARLHALALHRAGRDADALRTAREFRERLVDEHGLDPSPRLGELESMILERDPRLDRSVGGRRLRGYVLHEPIARSPLGTVHRAEQPSIGRQVAVTVLPPERADDPELVRAFEARVQSVAGLEHPHVLPVYDYWREPGGAYVVTRFPTGGTLDQRLRAGALDVDEALLVGEQIASALAAAHEAGIVHGDLGPDAVVVDERGDAFVWAFSLSGDAHASDDVAGLAALVTAAVTDSAAGGGVATAQLPPPVARAVERATSPTDDEVVTAAGLAAAFAAGRAGDEDVPASPVPTGPNPYRGLAAFRETDADVFFGRDGLVEQLLARIARTRAVAVVGPSGSGKSSAVRAGVLPQLRADGAFVTTMVPGTRPLAELEVALSRVSAVELHGVADEVAATPSGLGRVVRRLLPGAGGELVLVVDQFEELFTQSEPTERDLLLQTLLAAVEDPDAPVRVVVTLRADFLGQVLSHATAGQLVRDRSVMVAPLTDDELHQVVVGPAEVAGVAVEPALATAIVADAARAPGSLPMVQFALTEVFEAAEDGTMTLAAYRRIGGIEGVLGQRAEEVFAALDDADQRAAHQLFQRLVVPNADGPPTRRRAPRTELAHVPGEVIEAFGRARLLRFDHDQETREPTVEVTHEALFRAWPRLVAWIEEGEDDLRLLGHLTVTAHEWDDGGRAEADLYRGNRLEAAMDFADGRRDELSEVERTFLDASRARRARDADADRRTVRRLRVLTGGLAVGLVLALIAGSLALVAQRREAAARAEEAAVRGELASALETEQETSRQAQADALAFAARARVGDDLELAALFAAEAYAIEPDTESAAALLEVIGFAPSVRRFRAMPSHDNCGSAPPDSSVFVIRRQPPDEPAFADVRSLDLEPLGQVTLPDPDYCPAVDRTGEYVYVGSSDGLAAVEVATGEVVAQRSDLDTRSQPPRTYSLLLLATTEGRAVMATDDGGFDLVSLPDLTTLTEYPSAEDVGVPLLSANVGDTGGLLAVGAQDRVVLLDADGGVTESPPFGDGDFIYGAIAAERAGVVLALGINAIYSAPLDALDTFAPIEGVGGNAESLALHPDGDRIALATNLGLQVVTLPELGLQVTSEIASGLGIPQWGPDGALHWQGPVGLITLEPDRAAIGERAAALEVASGIQPAEALHPAADGRSAIYHGPNNARFWVDAQTGEQAQITTAERERLALHAALPGGSWLRVDLAAGMVERRRGAALLGTVALPAAIPRTLDRYWSIMRVDNGYATAVTTDLETGTGWVLAIDVATGELAAAIDIPAGEPQPKDARVLADDRLLVSLADGQAQVLDFTGAIISESSDLGTGLVVAVSPDGSRIALADQSGEILVADSDLKHLGTLTGRSEHANQLAFVTNDRLVARHWDGPTVLWDLPTGQEIGTLFSSDQFYPFLFEPSPDGSSILQAVPGGIHEISLDPDHWFHAACSLVTRVLQPEELAAVTPGREPLHPCGGEDGSA